MFVRMRAYGLEPPSPRPSTDPMVSPRCCLAASRSGLHSRTEQNLCQSAESFLMDFLSIGYRKYRGWEGDVLPVTEGDRRRAPWRTGRARTGRADGATLVAGATNVAPAGTQHSELDWQRTVQYERSA